MKTQAVWLSFDLGLQGDYEGLYAWLDSHRAKECGINVAFLRYKFNKNIRSELITDISNAFQQNPRTRVYAIFDAGTGTAGRFIIGGRKGSPPWSGYAPKKEKEVDDSTKLD